MIEKFDTNGSKLWTNLIGSTSNESGYKINLDSSGNVYVTGYTEGIVDGGSLKGTRDAVVAKFGTNGSKQWVRQLGDTYSEGLDVATDSSGNVYIVGYSYGDFDGNNNIGSTDIIIAKYNSTGTKQWSHQYGTSSHDKGTGITIDNSDNIYITGETYGNLYGNSKSGGYDIFVMKLNTDGIIQ